LPKWEAQSSAQTVSMVQTDSPSSENAALQPSGS
jgi:hypothetical protein